MTEMRTFRLKKLVCDGIVEAHLLEGGSVDYDTYEGDKLIGALIDKVPEELGELRAANTLKKQREELQDILDIVSAALNHLGIAPEAHDPKTFEDGHYINTVTLPADSEWAEYYASHPDRFPEVT